MATARIHFDEIHRVAGSLPSGTNDCLVSFWRTNGTTIAVLLLPPYAEEP